VLGEDFGMILWTTLVRPVDLVSSLFELAMVDAGTARWYNHTAAKA
jgi:hypothetical protein